jgi:polysaccharide biosynthesis transport protein
MPTAPHSPTSPARGEPPSRPGADAGPDEADRAVEQLMRFVGVLRRRWLVVAVTVVVAIAGSFVAISMLRPKWRASATVVLHLAGPQVLDKVKGVTDDNEGRVFAYKEYYQTQREIIGSRVVAARALGTLGLAQDPVFLGVDGIHSEPERLAKAQAVDPIDRLRELVLIEEVRGSRILRISADYPDPQIAADIANAVADAYLAHITQSRARTGVAAEENMSNERQKSLAQLQEAEKALADFKQKHGISSISLADRQNVITEAIIATNANYKKAEAERFAASAAYEEARRLHRAGSLASATLLPPNERQIFEDMRTEQLAAEREVEQLSVKYGEKMPDLQQARRRLALIEQRITREGKDLLDSLKARANAASATERQLSDSLAGEKERALELTRLEREYRELEREATTAAETYALVARRDTEIEMTNRVGSEDIEILDRATRPREPVFPPKALLVAIALMGGLTLGALLALAVDVRDHRIRGLLDLERAIAGFGLPVLGQLPLLPADARLGVGNLRAQRRQRDLHTLLYPQSLMAERCRAIRTSLGFVQGAVPCRTLVVTSPSSGEGKSSTAINLAISFSQAKKKVILVDADMRRPRLHQVFPAPIGKESVGLAGVLSGTCSLDEAILTPGEDLPDNLHVLLCGDIPQNPAELLDSPQARKLLAELAERYDVAVLDSPPVLPVTDPLILARMAHGLVVVARCQATTRSELQRTLGLLRQGDNNLLGVVLNEVDARREEAGYGVGYYAYHARETGPEQA